MSVSSRLLALIAAAAITATSFVLPAYAAPANAPHQVSVQSGS
jgi:hypothetical protein